MLPYIKTDNSLTVFINNEVRTIDADYPFWSEVIYALKENNEGEVKRLICLPDVIESYVHGDLTIVNDEVFYKNHKIKNGLTKRLVRMIKEGFPIDPLLAFLHNLLENPSNRAIQEAYTFLDTNNLPITDDGHFIAYKKINADWTDCHTGKINNSVGTEVSMPRNEVDDNPNNTCSHGLHVCSLAYLDHFGGARLVAVKVNPQNIVSVPIDYNNSKMRVCAYTVLTELNAQVIAEIDQNWPAVYEEPEYAPEDDEDAPEAYDDDETDDEYNGHYAEDNDD